MSPRARKRLGVLLVILGVLLLIDTFGYFIFNRRIGDVDHVYVGVLWLGLVAGYESGFDPPAPQLGKSYHVGCRTEERSGARWRHLPDAQFLSWWAWTAFLLAVFISLGVVVLGVWLLPTLDATD